MATASRPAARLSAEDRHQKILEVATTLFARQGFQGTTTRQIAEAAQVNEAIIFRHFPTKDDLYWAVIDRKCQEGSGRQVLTKNLSSTLPPHEMFARIAQDFFSLREDDPSLGRLLLFSTLENHQLSDRFFRTHMVEKYEMLAQYIREQIAAGVFRDVDPLMAARAFWGMVIYHFLVQEVFGAKRHQEFDKAEASRALADVWLNGMLPRDKGV